MIYIPFFVLAFINCEPFWQKSKPAFFFTRKSKFTHSPILLVGLNFHYDTILPQKQFSLQFSIQQHRLLAKKHHYHQSLSLLSSSSICLQLTLPLYLCEMLSYHYLNYLLNQHQINHISYHQSQSHVVSPQTENESDINSMQMITAAPQSKINLNGILSL